MEIKRRFEKIVDRFFGINRRDLGLVTPRFDLRTDPIISGSSIRQETFAREIADFYTDGEYSTLVGKETRDIVSVGNPEHSHQFLVQPWDKEVLGPQITDFTDHTYLYKARIACACGAEEIKGSRNLL